MRSCDGGARTEWRTLEESCKPRFLIGTATCGRAAGALEVLETLDRQLRDRGLDCQVMEVGCIGLCYAEPIVTVFRPSQPGVVYGNVASPLVEKLVESCLGDEPLTAGVLGTIGPGAIDGIPRLADTPVFQHQVRRVLGNCGAIDPNQIDHYIANDGYAGFAKALGWPPRRIIEEIKRAGLRGRGGAGFPTWRKWQFCREAAGERKYLICNADEGDPGAFMNRSLLEGDPHSLLEGMLVAGRALGAAAGYIYCRAEYPLALKRLRAAIAQAEEYGLLGRDILGSGFDFHVQIKEGAGAFVCGEETALIASIEGQRGMPRPRPPFPAISGLWGKPTVINNVETLACVALILRHDAEWFAQYGTAQSKGTKTFALVGKVKRPGLVEVPLGITLREMIFQIGGGLVDDRPFKAVQTGGPSGGCIPAAMLDTPVDYDSLKAVGSIMGSGGMVVMDDTTCMVDFARYFIDFVQKESCGKCPPCRLGTRQMLDILQDLTEGNGRPADLDVLLELAQGISQASLCGLGQTAPNPVLTTLRYFRDEYEAASPAETLPGGRVQGNYFVALSARLSDRDPGARLHCPLGRRAVPGGLCGDRPGQPTPFGLCAGVPSPLRSELPGREVGPPDRRAGAEAGCRGLRGEGGTLSRVGTTSARGAAGGHCRLRTGRSHGRLLPGQEGLSRNGSRGPPRSRRGVGGLHPGISPAPRPTQLGYREHQACRSGNTHQHAGRQRRPLQRDTGQLSGRLHRLRRPQVAQAGDRQ